jgi:hypothetical protein
VFFRPCKFPLALKAASVGIKYQRKQKEETEKYALGGERP